MMTGADFTAQTPATSSCADHVTTVASTPASPGDSSYADTHLTGPPLCAGCSQPILDQFILQVQGHVWHASCLRCSVCNILLSHVCYSGNSQLFCQDDFFRLYGAHCSSCTGAIAPTELVRRAHDNVYHLDCFRCRVCQHELRTGDEFYLCLDGQLLCKVDFMTVGVQEQCQDESTNPASETSKCNMEREELCQQQLHAQSTKPNEDVVETIAHEVGAEPTEVRSWFRQHRTKRRLKSHRLDNGHEDSHDHITSRVVAPPGGYPLPIVNRGHAGVRGYERADTLAKAADIIEGQPLDLADILNHIREQGWIKDAEKSTASRQLPESAHHQFMSVQAPVLQLDNQNHWAGWKDLWSSDFVPPNVNLGPENLSNGEVVGFGCQVPVTSISPQDLQDNLYM